MHCILFSCKLLLQTANAQANRELSNLVSPTKVNQSVIPITTNSKDLGTISMSWRSTYLAGSIYLDGKRFLTTGMIQPIFLLARMREIKGVLVTQEAIIPPPATKPFIPTLPDFPTPLMELTHFSLTPSGLRIQRTAIRHFIPTPQAVTTPLMDLGTLFQHHRCSHTACGYAALQNNSNGHYNTANGFRAGDLNDNNLFCTFIGYAADQNVSTDFTNSTAIGNASRITASNQVRIGNSSVTSIGGYEPWTNYSDGRFKKNVNENVPGLAFINQLHAITYTMDVTSLRSFLGEDRQNVG
jgi:hypothetical protein